MDEQPADPSELAIRYTLGDDPTKLLLRVPWNHGAVSSDMIVDFLTADGVDQSRLKAIRVYDRIFEAWSLIRNTHPLDGCPVVGGHARLLEIKLDLFPLQPLPQPPMVYASTHQASSAVSASGTSIDSGSAAAVTLWDERMAPPLAVASRHTASENFGRGAIRVPSYHGPMCGGMGYGPASSCAPEMGGGNFCDLGSYDGRSPSFGVQTSVGASNLPPYGRVSGQLGHGYSPTPPTSVPPQSMRSHSDECSTSEGGGGSTTHSTPCSAQPSAEWISVLSGPGDESASGAGATTQGEDRASACREGSCNGALGEAPSVGAARRARFAEGVIEDAHGTHGAGGQSPAMDEGAASLDTMQRLVDVGNGLGLPRLAPPVTPPGVPTPPSQSGAPLQLSRTPRALSANGPPPPDLPTIPPLQPISQAAARVAFLRHDPSGGGSFPPPSGPSGGALVGAGGGNALGICGGGPGIGHQLSSHSLARSAGIHYGDQLEFALLHAAPLVWRKKKMVMPLDHQALSLDFKGEVRALRDVLRRARKQVSLCSDVASSASMCEMLALKPSVLHLVCHGDMDESGAFFLGFEDAEGSLDQLSLSRLHALLTPAGLVRGTGLVFVSACHSQPAAQVFADCGVPHVVAVRAEAKVLDDAAALFARHLYLALVQGNTVRASFQVKASMQYTEHPTDMMAPVPAKQPRTNGVHPVNGDLPQCTLGQMGAAALAATAPSMRMPDPAGEASKFVLLPQAPRSSQAPASAVTAGALSGLGGMGGSGLGGFGRSDMPHDPHEVVLFHGLPPGEPIDRNPLPPLEPPYLQKPFLGRAIELRELVLMLGRKRQKEVRLVTLTGKPGVGKTNLAIAAAGHLYERRWFPDGCVCVELSGRRSQSDALVALAEALEMELRSLSDVARGLKNWRGLLVFDGVDDTISCPVARPLIAKLLTTKELRVLCTSREPLELEGERVFKVQPLHPHDAARLFRDLAIEALPPELRNANALLQHPVLKAFGGMPRAICQAAPVLRQGATLEDLERDLFPPQPPTALAASVLPHTASVDGSPTPAAATTTAMASAENSSASVSHGVPDTVGSRVSIATSPMTAPRSGHEQDQKKFMPLPTHQATDSVARDQGPPLLRSRLKRANTIGTCSTSSSSNGTPLLDSLEKIEARNGAMSARGAGSSHLDSVAQAPPDGVAAFGEEVSSVETTAVGSASVAVASDSYSDKLSSYDDGGVVPLADSLSAAPLAVSAAVCRLDHSAVTDASPTVVHESQRASIEGAVSIVPSTRRDEDPLPLDAPAHDLSPLSSSRPVDTEATMVSTSILEQEDAVQKMVRKTMEISLTFLRHTNAAAYTLLAVITLLPGGVLAMELDELWDVDDVGVRAAISEACMVRNANGECLCQGALTTAEIPEAEMAVPRWEPLMQVLVQRPGDSPEDSELVPAHAEMRWLVRRRTIPMPQLPRPIEGANPRSARYSAESVDHFMSELDPNLDNLLPPKAMRRLACRCARHFATLGERVVALLEQENSDLAKPAASMGTNDDGSAGDHGGAPRSGDEAMRWRKVMSDSLAPNMWACLSHERLSLIKSSEPEANDFAESEQREHRHSHHGDHAGPCFVRHSSGEMEPCVRHTARVGEALSRILAILGRIDEAASAAEKTIEALQFLGVTADMLGDLKLLLGGQMLLRADDPGALNLAQAVLHEAVLAYAEAPSAPSDDHSSSNDSETDASEIPRHGPDSSVVTSRGSVDLDALIQDSTTAVSLSAPHPSLRASCASMDVDALGICELGSSDGGSGTNGGAVALGSDGNAGAVVGAYPDESLSGGESLVSVSLSPLLHQRLFVRPSVAASVVAAARTSKDSSAFAASPAAGRVQVAAEQQPLAGSGPSIMPSCALASTWPSLPGDSVGSCPDAMPNPPATTGVALSLTQLDVLASVATIDGENVAAAPPASALGMTLATRGSVGEIGSRASSGQQRWKQVAGLASARRSRRQMPGLIKALLMLGNSYIKDKQIDVDTSISAGLSEASASLYSPKNGGSTSSSPSREREQLPSSHTAREAQLAHAEKYFIEVLRRLPPSLRSLLHAPGSEEELRVIDAMLSRQSSEGSSGDAANKSFASQSSSPKEPPSRLPGDGGSASLISVLGGTTTDAASSEASTTISATDEEREHWMVATAGLAWLALIRGDPQRAVSLLGTAIVDDPAVLELRGKSRAAMGELDAARELMLKAAELWQDRGDGVRAQSALASHEAMRRALLLRHDGSRSGAPRLMVMHAAPLILWQPQLAPAAATFEAKRTCAIIGVSSGKTGMRLRPVAFSKRAGLRCWRHLRESLAAMRRKLLVQFEVATRASLAAALEQPEAPMLHFLPAPDYMGGMSLEGEAGELVPLPLPELRALLSAASTTPSLVLLSAGCSEEAGRAFLEAGCRTVIAIRGRLPEAQVTAFCAAFYGALLDDGRTPRDAFAVAAAAAQRERAGARQSLVASDANSEDVLKNGAVDVPGRVTSAASGGRFVLLGAAPNFEPLPPPGEMEDVSRQQCPWNLDSHARPVQNPTDTGIVSMQRSCSCQGLRPTSAADATVCSGEVIAAATCGTADSPAAARDPQGWQTAPLRRRRKSSSSESDESSPAVDAQVSAPAASAGDPSRATTTLALVPGACEPAPASARSSTGSAPLAHGIAFVGRHLELHELLVSCLRNQLTYVHGARGLGKSALVLEAATYLRQRGAFPHGIFVCSLDGLRKTDRVRAQLGATLNFPARSAAELSVHLSRFNQCLLILDRCEAAIANSRTQFFYFLDQLLSAGVRLLVSSSSQAPIDLDELRRESEVVLDTRADVRARTYESGLADAETEMTRRPPLTYGLISLQPMSPKDAALLLLELCERPLDMEELLDPSATSDEEASFDLLGTLRHHELINKLGGLPISIQWAATRLKDVSVGELVQELRALKPRDQARLVKQASLGGASLAPPPMVPRAATHERGGGMHGSRKLHGKVPRSGSGEWGRIGEAPRPSAISRRASEHRRRGDALGGAVGGGQGFSLSRTDELRPSASSMGGGQLSSILSDLVHLTKRLSKAAAVERNPDSDATRVLHAIHYALGSSPPLALETPLSELGAPDGEAHRQSIGGGRHLGGWPRVERGEPHPHRSRSSTGGGRRDAHRQHHAPGSRRAERKGLAADDDMAIYDYEAYYDGIGGGESTTTSAHSEDPRMGYRAADERGP